MLKKIADLANEKKIEGISYVNDESDQKGMRGIIILKHDAVANVVLNNLFKYTPMQTTFAINNIALVDKRPMTLGLKDLIKNFVDHRHEIILRRTRYELAQAMKRLHILEGLLIAQQNIDEVINIIKTSPSPDAARQTLMARFGLSEEQATAILEMRLRQLTALEQDKLQAEHDELEKLVNYLNQVLSDEALQMKIIRDEMVEIREKYADERRTEIIASANEFNPEDFYANEDVVITISHLGYIKRTSLTEYRTQNRAGVGVKDSSTRDEDFIEYIYIASMHDTMLLFTEKGRCHWLKVYDIPEGTRASKGRAVQNVINIAPDDRIRAYLNVKQLNDKEYAENHYVVMCTANGIIKKTSLEEYSRPRTNGVNAITVKDDDMLLTALITSGNSEILMAARNGKAIRFHESNVRAIGRTGVGVKGIEIDDDDRVVGMIAIEPDKKDDILVVSENGYGKRSDLEDYRITNRGGKGVKTINITDKTGDLIAIQAVTDENDLMIINRSGVTIRTKVEQIRLAGRATQGVWIINLREGDVIASVMAVPVSEDEEIEPTTSGEMAEGATEGVTEAAAEATVETTVEVENAPQTNADE
jgi:DNA gyrase subunit A